jgi:endonuclease YncB( thermonuclease family)
MSATPFSAHPIGFEQAMRMGCMRALGVSNHDGDTITALVDLGFACYQIQDLRIAGINTPEVVGTSGAELERALNAKVRTSALTVGQPLLITTHRTRTGAPVRSFERYVATVGAVTVPDGQTTVTDVGSTLVYEGLADEVG